MSSEAATASLKPRASSFSSKPSDVSEGLGVLTRITRMTLAYPWQVGLAVAGTVAAVLMQLSIPLLLGRAVDQAQQVITGGTQGQAAEQALWATAGMLLFVSVARGIFTMVQNYYAESVGHHVAYKIRLMCYEKIQHLSFSFHGRVHSGDLITVGLLDVEGVRMFFSTGLIRVVLLTLLIGIGAFMLLSTDLVLGLLALSFVPFVGWRSAVSRLQLRAAWLRLQEWLAVLTQVMDENLSGIRVVRAFAAQAFELAKFDRASKVTLGLQHERVDIRVRNTSVMTFSFFIAMGLVLVVGGYQVKTGQTSVGTLTSFLTFMTILQMPVRQIGMMVNSFARASTCGYRLFQLLDIEPDIRDADDAKSLDVKEGVLRFDNVDFAYPNAPDRPVLKKVSFTARRGQTIGIVGPPGSGKSTIASLLPRFYDVTGGAITIDGQDVRHVTLESLRSAVGVVQQDSFLFTTTIENNIAYGDPWASDQRIERAAESAQLHNYVLGLPQDYNTVVGERGVSLSGGQRQRLSIARVLMLRPPILVFDDSTAAIDAGTEQRIRSAMHRMAGDSIMIVIAHRLSSLMHADEILFLEDGEIVERGTHEALLAKGGRYHALYELQVRPGDEMLNEIEEGRDGNAS
ncbi:ABC transporter ATP-binding protein [uncultured Martelella sp.]|uniref:ABC transporter ATP-binding protein n=1 Tax=uncultured Martelella sp. TaxID=392331 RepID=UPI0029C76BFA|nr:ABC transporter ATP-binding protein [uncultured Martelella sp.]